MSYEVSVIIPSFCSGLKPDEKLYRLIDSIRAQQFEADKFEVIVVFNGLTAEAFSDEVSARTKNYGFKIKFLFSAAVGVNRARNSGLEAAEGDILIFLDDDCELIDKKFISIHVERHKKEPDVFAFGGGYVLFSTAGFYDEIYNSIQMKWLAFGQKPDGFARYLMGGNFSVKREFIISSGLRFNDDIIYGGSEYEFFKKANLLNLKLKTLELDVLHNTSETLFKLMRKNFMQGRGKFLIEKKYPLTDDELTLEQNTMETSFKKRIFLLFLNYCFWLGYYRAAGRPLLILKHMIKELVGRLNKLRYDLLSKLQR